jgi:hypothetical protein
MLRFRLELVGRGWARFLISQGPRGADVTVSHLSDAIGDFVAAVQSLPRGARRAVCHMDAEPGGFRWTFERKDTMLMIVIQSQGDEPEPFTDFFELQCGLMEFARAVIDELDRNLALVGTYGYEREWGHRFPDETYRRLKEVLDAA